jgi:hypothetical protein
MLVYSITFDDGLDIQPQTGEEFEWTPGDPFVLHFNNDPIPEGHPYNKFLYAAYNTRFIREICFAQPRRINANIPNNSCINGQDDFPYNGDVQQAETPESDHHVSIPDPPQSSDAAPALPRRNDTTETTSLELCNDSDATPLQTADGGYLEEAVEDTPLVTYIQHPGPVKLIDICTCDPDPDPNCPVCRRDYLDPH